MRPTPWIAVLSVVALGLTAWLLVLLLLRDSDATLHYGVVIDAGSQGSRVYVYSWFPHHNESSSALFPGILPSPVYLKVSPGIARLYDDSLEELTAYLWPLLVFAKANVPERLHYRTPIWLKATAGARLLTLDQQATLMDNVEQVFERYTDFDVSDTAATVIPGSYEGGFMWLAVNIALGTLTKTSPLNTTVGVLDCGGASAQLAYIPASLAPGESFPLEDQVSFEPALYSSTWLGYGLDQALYRNYRAALAPGPNATTDRLDPCLPIGVYNEVEAIGLMGVGTGNATECLAAVLVTLNATAPCAFARCGPAGEIEPVAWPASGQFYAANSFIKGSTIVGLPLGAATPRELRDGALRVCALDKDALAQLDEDVDVVPYSELCFTAMWTSALMLEGFGLAADEPVIFQQEIRGYATSWTLGAMFFEGQVYTPPALREKFRVLYGDRSFTALVIITVALLILVVAVIAVLVAALLLRRESAPNPEAQALLRDSSSRL